MLFKVLSGLRPSISLYKKTSSSTVHHCDLAPVLYQFTCNRLPLPPTTTTMFKYLLFAALLAFAAAKPLVYEYPFAAAYSAPVAAAYTAPVAAYSAYSSAYTAPYYSAYGYASPYAYYFR